MLVAPKSIHIFFITSTFDATDGNALGKEFEYKWVNNQYRKDADDNHCRFDVCFLDVFKRRIERVRLGLNVVEDVQRQRIPFLFRAEVNKRA